MYVLDTKIIKVYTVGFQCLACEVQGISILLIKRFLRVIDI